MKITPQILYQRVKGPLNDALHLDLTGLGIGAIEGLEHCPNLESIDLSHNCLEDVENFEHCKNLWRFNLADNKICCVRSLSKMFAIGTLDLSNNDLSWTELLRIRHVFILDLRLYGNEALENDTYYRLHVIDCLPNVWALDGRLITSAERLQVQQFFEDSAMSQRPVRHKFEKNSFFDALASKSTDIHGTRTLAFSSNFPVNEKHNRETDKRRLKFLACNIEEDLKNQKKSMKRPCSYISNNCLQVIMEKRSTDREKCNMLLLLLIASVEFELPENLIHDALITAKLNPLFNADTSQFFHLDVRTRTEVISLLVSSCKLDREIDKSNAGGLYDRLYLTLYHSVAYLLQKTSKTKKKDWIEKNPISSRPTTASSYYRHVAEPRSLRNQVQWKDHQTLLASEVSLLLSVVPSFYEYIFTDNPKVHILLLLATGDNELYENLKEWTEIVASDEGDTNMLCKEICKSVITRMERAKNAATAFHGGRDFSSRPQSCKKSSPKITQTNLILNAPDAYPKRPKSAVLTSGERLTHAKKFHKNSEFINMVKSYDVQHFSLGSYVLLGPQNLARVIALPEPHVALVQMNLIPNANGSVRVFANDMDEHYCYVDVRKLTYDYVERYWKPRGAVGDSVTLQLDNEPEALSIAEEKALKRGNTPGSVSSYSRRMVAYSSRLHKVDPSSSSFSPSVPPASIASFFSKESSRIIAGPGSTPSQDLSPQPLSSLYCAKMELSFPEIAYQSTETPQHPEIDELTEDSYHPPIPVVGSALERNEFDHEVTESSIPTFDDSEERAAYDEADVKSKQVEILPEHSIGENEASEQASLFGEEQVEPIDEAEFERDDDAIPNDDDESGLTSAMSFRLVDGNADLESELEEQLQITDRTQEDAMSSAPPVDDDVDRSETPIAQPLNETNENQQFSAQQTAASDVEEQSSNQDDLTLNGKILPLDERANEKKQRVKSAPESKLHSSLSNFLSSRPSSAAIPPKKVLFSPDKSQKNDSRPGSASSFQLMRTEAWKSSASSVSTGLQQPSGSLEKFTHFVVDSGHLKKNPRIKFTLKMKRPPPQRPTSPDHVAADPAEDAHRRQYDVVSSSPPFNHPTASSRSEPLLTARWLADGRDVHQENIRQKQRINSRRVPGYLDYSRLPSNLMKKKRSLTKGSLGFDKPPSRPVRPSSMHPYTYQRRNILGNQPPMKRVLPFDRPMTSWYRPHFSTTSGIKRLSSLPHGFLARPFGR